LEFAGERYHVTSHDDRQEDIFVGEEDWLARVEVLSSIGMRFN
jgi:hypothetical protein